MYRTVGFWLGLVKVSQDEVDEGVGKMDDDLLTCDVPRVHCDGATPAIETYSHPVVITWRWSDLTGDAERYLDARIQTPTIIAIRGSPARNMWTSERTAPFRCTNSWWTAARRTWLETIQFTILTLFNHFFTNINLFTCISKECQEAFTSTVALVEIFLKLFWFIEE